MGRSIFLLVTGYASVGLTFASLSARQWRPAVEVYDGPDSKHNDFQTAQKVIEAVVDNKDRAFFIADDFHKSQWREPDNSNAIAWEELYDHRTECSRSVRLQGRLEFCALRGLAGPFADA